MIKRKRLKRSIHDSLRMEVGYQINVNDYYVFDFCICMYTAMFGEGEGAVLGPWTALSTFNTHDIIRRWSLNYVS